MNLDSSMKVVAIVGMSGSGKSEAARIFESNGYRKVRFGDVTDEQVAKNGLELNEENERSVRESLRKEHGMAAYAILNLPRIEEALRTSKVVVDGLYSWEEYKVLKERFKDTLHLMAVWAPPDLRYRRLKNRTVRPLTYSQAMARDYAEIENVNKGGPIAMADFTINNDSTMESLAKQIHDIIETIK